MKKIMIIVLCIMGLYITGCKKESQPKTQADITKCYTTYQNELTNTENLVAKNFMSRAEADRREAEYKTEYENCISK